MILDAGIALFYHAATQNRAECRRGMGRCSTAAGTESERWGYSGIIRRDSMTIARIC